MSAGVKKVLYVENDTFHSQFALDLFREHEPALDVFHVSNGAMAWSLLSKGYRPDIIISDLKMPKMDGRALLANVREAPELRDIPFVLLSDGPAEEPAGKECSMIKPYSTQQFLSLMEKVKSACELVPQGYGPAAPVTV